MTNLKIMIMGVGNVLLTDEGAGVHALKELAKHDLPEGVELLEGGTAGMELLHLIEEVDHLVIIDSVNAGSEPGAIFKFKPDDISVLPPEYNVSAHQVGIIEVLKMGQIFGKLPGNIVIFGIQPKSLEWGLDVTPEIGEKLPLLVDFVLEEVRALARQKPN